jgi:hypothetical protein
MHHAAEPFPRLRRAWRKTGERLPAGPSPGAKLTVNV